MNVKALVGAFNQEKALVGAFSVIVKTGCGTDEALHSTRSKTARPAVPGSDHRVVLEDYLRVITTVGRAPDPGTSFMQSAA